MAMPALRQPPSRCRFLSDAPASASAVAAPRLVLWPPTSGSDAGPLAPGHRHQDDPGLNRRYLAGTRSQPPHRAPTTAHFPSSLNCYARLVSASRWCDALPVDATWVGDPTRLGRADRLSQRAAPRHSFAPLLAPGSCGQLAPGRPATVYCPRIIWRTNSPIRSIISHLRSIIEERNTWPV